MAARLVHTSSGSGLSGNPGQANYGAAKAGVAALSLICAKELNRYGVHSNCLVPTAGQDDRGDAVAERANQGPCRFCRADRGTRQHVTDRRYLAMADCPFNGCTFSVRAGTSD